MALINPSATANLVANVNILQINQSNDEANITALQNANNATNVAVIALQNANIASNLAVNILQNTKVTSSTTLGAIGNSSTSVLNLMNGNITSLGIVNNLSVNGNIRILNVGSANANINNSVYFYGSNIVGIGTSSAGAISGGYGATCQILTQFNRSTSWNAGLLVLNDTQTYAANSYVTIMTASTNGGSPWLCFDVLYGNAWAVGLDNGQGAGSKLKFTTDSAFNKIGANMTIASIAPEGNLYISNRMSVGNVNPTAPLYVTALAANNLDPTSTGIYCYNANVTANANAIITARTNSNTGGFAMFTLDTQSQGGWSICNDNADANKLKFNNTWNYSGGSNVMVLNRSTGNVGIATESPMAKLDVQGHINSGFGLFSQSYANITFTNQGAQLAWNRSGGLAEVNIISVCPNAYVTTAGIEFANYVVGSTYTAFGKFTPTGLGIGTTNPSCNLVVNGNAQPVILTNQNITNGTNNYTTNTQFLNPLLSTNECLTLNLGLK